MHICCSEGQGALGVSCFLFEFVFILECVRGLLFFLLAGMFFLNSWACLGWSSIWALVDLPMRLEVGLSDGLAVLCLRVSVPVHRCSHELSESGCCAEEF